MKKGDRQLGPTAAEVKRRLVGRRIVKVLLRPFNDRRGGDHWKYATDPVITLDDGTTLSFLTQETDTGEYGVQLCVSVKDDGTEAK